MRQENAMPQVKPSFMAEVRNALATSRFTEQDIELEFPQRNRGLSPVY
jgi:hypothetical protein